MLCTYVKHSNKSTKNTSHVNPTSQFNSITLLDQTIQHLIKRRFLDLLYAMFSKKCIYWYTIGVLLLISNGIRVTSFMTPTLSVTPSTYKPPPTSLYLSSYDSKYYTPTEQPAQSGNSQSQSRITLSRFLSQYVKDHPEVSVAGCSARISIGTTISEKRMYKNLSFL